MTKKTSERTSEILRIGERLTLQLVREPFRRGIRMHIAPNGTLSVVASRSIKTAELAKFVMVHLDWVEERTRHFDQLRENNPPKSCRPGERWLFLGEELRLLFLRAEIKRPRAFRHGAHLVCEVPVAEYSTSFLWAPQPRFHSVIQRFYKHQAEKVITPRVAYFAERLELRPKRLGYRAQRTLWGSCTSSGNLSLNWKLIAAPPHIIDYVVVHELCHLKHPNHSRNFWTLVGTQVPDFRTSRKWLRNHQFDFDFLSKESDLYLSRI